MLALILACTINTGGVHAQTGTPFWDQTTQGTVAWNGGWIFQEATCNIGQFALVPSDGEPTTIKLMGNSGEVIQSTIAPYGIVADPDCDEDDNTEDATIACNHNSTLAVIGTYNLYGYELINVCAMSNSPGSGIIHMRGQVMSSSMPSPQLTYSFPSDGNYPLNVQAAMDNEYLYITFGYWRNDLNHWEYWYAIVQLGDSPSWKVSPRVIPRPVDGLTAWGTAQPTVGCNRWMYSNGNAVIGFAYVDPITGRQIPATFSPPISGPPPDATKLPEPSTLVTPMPECYWVRAVDFDNPDGTPLPHYFYAYASNPSGSFTHNTLWSTDGATVMSIPISTNLVIYPWFGSTLASPAVGDPYLAATTNASVYCAYVENPSTLNLRICRQWGDNDISIGTTSSTCTAPNTLGCNQMGVFVPYYHSPTDLLMWRAFRQFNSDIIENTLATGLCQVAPRGDEEFSGILGIGVGTHENLDDTLRVYEESSITPSQLFAFVEPNPATFPIALWAGEPPNPVFSVDADPGNARGDIIFDNAAIVDFGGAATIPVTGVTLRARSDGSIEYNGSVFNHEKADLIGCVGETRVRDTTEKRRGIWYMNAPLIFSTTGGIYNGSTFGGVTGEVRFIQTSSSLPYLSITGAGSGMNFDTTNMYLGTTSCDAAQIIAEDDGDGNGPPGNITFTNGLLTDLWQHSGLSDDGDWTQQPYPGMSSGISITGAQNINFTSNTILYSTLWITNPVSTVTFSSNSCEAIDQQLWMSWTLTTSIFGGQTNIIGNTMHANWPCSDEPFNDYRDDFVFIGFNVTDQHRILVTSNTFNGTNMCGTENIWNPSSTAIALAYGTNAGITDNTITDYGIGVYNDIVGSSNSFECQNTITQTNGPRGIGILEDLDMGACFPKLNQCSNLAVGYSANGLNGSTLVKNNFFDNDTGASFHDYVKTILDGSHTGPNDFAGNNHFVNNTVTQVQIGGSGTSAQPEFGGDACFGDGTPGVEQPKWGQNTFTETSGSILFSGGAELFWPLDDNHWSPTIPHNYFLCIPTSFSDPDMNLSEYTDDVDGTQPDNAFSCGSFVTKHEKIGTLSGHLSPLVDTNSPSYLYYEALNWNNINPQFALDTMRLFVEREPHYLLLAENGIGYTETFVAEMDTFDSAGIELVNKQMWIDEYNWLASVYTLDTTQYYRATVLQTMASCEIYFDRNGACNLWYNYSLIFPDSMDVGIAYREIAAIRAYQKLIPEDTTPFHVIPIPPLPYGQSYVQTEPAPSGLSLSVVPNPANQSMTAYINTSSSETATLEIYDALGHIVMNLPAVSLEAGSNHINIDCHSLTAGNYYMRFSSGETVKTVSLAIEH